MRRAIRCAIRAGSIRSCSFLLCLSIYAFLLTLVTSPKGTGFPGHCRSRRASSRSVTVVEPRMQAVAVVRQPRRLAAAEAPISHPRPVAPDSGVVGRRQKQRSPMRSLRGNVPLEIRVLFYIYLSNGSLNTRSVRLAGGLFFYFIHFFSSLLIACVFVSPLYCFCFFHLLFLLCYLSRRPHYRRSRLS
jgi:hypothetical protein